MAHFPFERVWWGVGLSNYRDEKGTYTPWELDTLPPLSVTDLDGSFSWLSTTSLPPPPTCGDSDRVEFDVRFENLQRRADELGLCLPKPFLRFMSDEDLRNRVLAITGSFWKLDSLEPCPISDGYLALCRSDSQACLLWYLYLDSATSEHCVVVSEDYFGSDVESYGERDPESPADIYLCSDSFEAFVYREWIEHSAAWHMMRAKPLSEREQVYLDHYRPPGDTSDRRPKCEIHGCVLKPGQWLGLGKQCKCLEWRGNWSYPPELGQLPRRACLYYICGWKNDESVTTASDTAFCPLCRKEMMAFLRERRFTALVELLHDRLGIART